MGLVLDESQGIMPLTVHYSSQVKRGGAGKPFWTALGSLKLQRETFAGDKDRDAERFWSQPRRFFVPAFECPLEFSSAWVTRCCFSRRISRKGLRWLLNR